MKIENKIANYIDFRVIGVGDVFRDGEQIYMRTINAIIGGVYCNAVNLESGGLKGFDDYDSVTPLYDAKVVI